MTQTLPKIAVVGHTNTGKTSLLRSLTRDPNFGDVSNRPATTQVVSAAPLILEGKKILELFDTPGLEDPMALLDLLTTAHDRGADWIDSLQSVLAADRTGRFGQENLALQQVIASDLALYVIDAREAVLGKYRDELEILSRCAVPILPVLNFVASPEAQVDLWRSQLARLNLHLSANFDTVVLDLENERLLFEKMQSLLHGHGAVMGQLLDHLAARRTQIRQAACEVIAELLVDAAALRIVAQEGDQTSPSALEQLQDHLRQREELCLKSLLQLHNFRPDDALAQELPVAEGRWGLDLFSPESLKQFGITTSSAAAVGAMSGLAVDVVVGGLTLGAAAATGAAVGAVIGAAREKGRDIITLVTGESELRAEAATLILLAERQVYLQRKLEVRGHAAQQVIEGPTGGNDPSSTGGSSNGQPLDSAALLDHLKKARAHDAWCSIGQTTFDPADRGRLKTLQAVAGILLSSL